MEGALRILVESGQDMATGWIKSLQCKSKAPDDVVHHHYRHKNPKNHQAHHHPHSCRNSIQSIRDIVETTKKSKPKKWRVKAERKDPPQPSKPPQPQQFKRTVSRETETETGPDLQSGIGTRSTGNELYFSSLTELPEGHPSRNIVEIIFHTSWGKKNFSGRVEMVLKVQNSTWTANRFEEYRKMVKSRASFGAAGDGSKDHVRCVADGNEVMEFYCLGDTTTGGGYETGDGAWAFHIAKKEGVCTFSGSGAAHENAGGDGKGQRAMLVFRVIAGRVGKQLTFDSFLQGRSVCDSVGGDNGELIVFDTRALFPCFLIIYHL